VTVALAVSIAAALAACAAAGAAFVALRRTQAASKALDDEIERGKARFDQVLAGEAELRAEELEQSLALARSQAISVLGEEERRITEERRRDVAERERDATAKLVAALTEAQRSVEERFADWGSEVAGLQHGLTSELERVGTRQQQLIAAIEAKVTAEAERLESTLEEHRARVAKIREELDRTIDEVSAAVAADLETHAAERRRALHEVAERLRRRERELAEQIEREQAEATQRIGSQLQDIERRALEQVRRIVSRESQHLAEAAATQFDGTIRTAREDAARRLGRELDMAVERFAREGESLLAERVESELRVFEARLADLSRRLDSLSTRT
jgi:hypothetical protein